MILEGILSIIEGRNQESGFGRVVVIVYSFAICTPGKTWSNFNNPTLVRNDSNQVLQSYYLNLCHEKIIIYRAVFNLGAHTHKDISTGLSSSGCFLLWFCFKFQSLCMWWWISMYMVVTMMKCKAYLKDEGYKSHDVFTCIASMWLEEQDDNNWTFSQHLEAEHAFWKDFGRCFWCISCWRHWTRWCCK